MWAKSGVVVQKLEFPVWQVAFGLMSPNEELGKFEVVSTAKNLATLGTC